MRAFHTALTTVAILAAGPALAQSMAGIPGMDHGAQAAKIGKGVGVVTAIDSKANTLTIKHGPIPAVNWPAMTMTFKANPPALLKGLRVGQKIGFDMKAQGMAAEVTSVRAQ
jgi:Cu(I)/Ag(I) efflux system protein CusF